MHLKTTGAEHSPAQTEAIGILMARLSAAMRALGGKLVDVGSNSATLVVDWREDLVGNPESGALMNGVIATMIDNVSAMAFFMATNCKSFPLATLDLRIEHMKPSQHGKPLHVHSECHKVGRQVAFFRATVWHPDEPDDMVATGSGTFMVSETDPTLSIQKPQ